MRRAHTGIIEGPLLLCATKKGDATQTRGRVWFFHKLASNNVVQKEVCQGRTSKASRPVHARRNRVVTQMEHSACRNTLMNGAP